MDEDTKKVQDLKQYYQFKRYAEFCKMLDKLCKDPANRPKLQLEMERVLVPYLEIPYLLDPFLERLTTPAVTLLRSLVVNEKPSIQLIEKVEGLSAYLYRFVRIRGYKTIVKFFSHETSDILPVFELLKFFKTEPKFSLRFWQSEYILLLWFSLLAMVPFPLDQVTIVQGGFTLQLLEFSKSYLLNPSKQRDGAAIFIARLLTRPDTINILLKDYINWALNACQANDPLICIGILTSLCNVVKLAPRGSVHTYAEDLWHFAQRISELYESNQVIQKLLIKLSYRVALLQFNEPINRNVRNRKNIQDVLLNTTSMEVQVQEEEEEEEEVTEVNEQVEEIIAYLIDGLKNSNTVVRWSAAKGISYIAVYLPAQLTRQVVEHILEIFSEDATIGANGNIDMDSALETSWHGACLGLAELARRKLIPGPLYPQLVDYAVQALYYDVRKGSFSVGSNVRDSACYVFWALARSQAVEELRPLAEKMAQALMVAALFDREVHVRRAASAAFQESVGRLGIFPHGIELVAIADYFNVGNRRNAFVEVSVKVAEYKIYVPSMVDHLINGSIKNWDKEVREVAALALGALAKHLTEKDIQTLLSHVSVKELDVRHGGILAITEICGAVGNNPELKDLASTLQKIPERALEGFGVELMMIASCKFIQRLCECRWDVEPETLALWRKMIRQACFSQQEELTLAAAAAISAYSSSYGFPEDEILAYIKELNNYKSLNNRRGIPLLLGSLCPKVFLAHQEVIFPEMLEHAKIKKLKEQNDPSIRKNVVIALTNIVTTTDITYDKTNACILAFSKGLIDHTIDNRGDVGSWVREACILGLEKVLALVGLKVEKKTSIKLMGLLLRNCADRIDRVRQYAGRLVQQIIAEYPEENSPRLDHLEDLQRLRKHLKGNIDWVMAADKVIGHLAPLLSITAYRQHLLAGLITACTSLSEALSKDGCDVFVRYVNSLPPTSTNGEFSLEDFITALLSLYDDSRKNIRLVMSIISVLGVLLDAGMTAKSELLHELFNRVKALYETTKDAKKLNVCIPLVISLLSKDQSLLEGVLYLLCHSYPAIRRETSEQLYLHLSNAHVLNEQAEEILLTTDWMANDYESKVEELRRLLVA